jgi:EAL domain-containing protein (putative c-di-GMP-specific phosphodiesterase class I)/CheY-like chemotaxis protein
MDPIRVLVADDEPEVLSALADVVRSDRSLLLVGTAGDASQAVELAEAHRPDVALVDVVMPNGGGTRAAEGIRAASPRTRILAFSAHGDRSSVMAMLRAGAVGYLVKGAPVAEVLDAVHRAWRGDTVLSTDVAGQVVHELAGHLRREAREVSARRDRTGRIRRLLQAGGPTMVFQPIVRIGTGETVGFEALSRFPELTPDVWFTEASEVGLREDLELSALAAALVHLPELPAPTYLSVNVSPQTMLLPEFARGLLSVPPARVVLEVTEHAAVEDYGSLEQALRGHRARGMRVAVDDAGAGFASLRHILRLAPDLIKLDLSLTRDIHRDRSRRALATALISFASEIGAEIVAEGVEARDELEALAALEVGFAQGYYLGRPGPLPPGQASG